MPRDIEQILAESEERRRQILSDIPPESTWLPTWVSFTGQLGAFIISLGQPTPTPTPGASPLIDTTSPNRVGAIGAYLSTAPLIFYQVQLADDIGFTTNSAIYDIGSSRSYTVHATADNQTKFARVSARTENSLWSSWIVASTSANSGAIAQQVSSSVASQTFTGETQVTSLTITTSATGWVEIFSLGSFQHNSASILCTFRIRKDTIAGTVLHIIALTSDPTTGVNRAVGLFGLDSSPAASQTYIVSAEAVSGTGTAINFSSLAANRRI